jgi:DNA-binding MarR family transcriptional regulator
MSKTILPRNSVEYLEILSEVFVELMRKATTAQDAQRDDDITPSLIQCLQYVYLHGPSSIRKIATGLGITVPAVSQLVDRLVQRGLVTREHNKEDRRYASVSLTDEGKQVVLDARTSRLAWLRTILDRIPEDKRATLVDSLEEFIHTALETTGRVDEACVRCGIDHLAFCVVNKVHISSTGEPLGEF